MVCSFCRHRHLAVVALVRTRELRENTPSLPRKIGGASDKKPPEVERPRRTLSCACLSALSFCISLLSPCDQGSVEPSPSRPLPPSLRWGSLEPLPCFPSLPGWCSPRVEALLSPFPASLSPSFCVTDKGCLCLQAACTIERNEV